MDMLRIYDRGADAWSFRQQLRKRVRVDTAAPGEPPEVARRVELLCAQKQQMQALWASVRQPQPDHERMQYDQDMANHDQAIEHLEWIVDRDCMDRLLDGRVLALGFRNKTDRAPSPIHPTEWAFLEIDYRANSASSGDGGYRALRFVLAKDLTDKEFDSVNDAWAINEDDNNTSGSAESGPCRMNLRVERIGEVIRSLEYDPMKIPRGGKATIQTECLKDAKLFTKSTFPKAWQEAKRRELLEVENVDAYKP